LLVCYDVIFFIGVYKACDQDEKQGEMAGREEAIERTWRGWRGELELVLELVLGYCDWRVILRTVTESILVLFRLW
jgi:hypothetical protein